MEVEGLRAALEAASSAPFSISARPGVAAAASASVGAGVEYAVSHQTGDAAISMLLKMYGSVSVRQGAVEAENAHLREQCEYLRAWHDRLVYENGEMRAQLNALYGQYPAMVGAPPVVVHPYAGFVPGAVGSAPATQALSAEAPSFFPDSGGLVSQSAEVAVAMSRGQGDVVARDDACSVAYSTVSAPGAL